MAITVFGRGYPLSAVDDGTTLKIAYGGTAILDVTTSGLSGTIAQGNSTTLTATSLCGTTLSGTTVQGVTICGATVASAHNLACTYTGGGSAGISAGTGQAISADRFLKVTIGGKTYYMPCFASAGTLSAV